MNSTERKDRETTVIAIVVFYVIAIALGYWFGGRQDELVVGRGRLPFPEQLLRRIHPAHWVLLAVWIVYLVFTNKKLKKAENIS